MIWRRLWNRKRWERELDSELRYHFDRQVADNLRAGMSEEEARRGAQLEFGGVHRVKADCRDSGGVLWLDNTMQDLRYALRGLKKNPGFALAAAFTLALGIGANAAIFTIINAVVLRPLPYAHPERVVWATEFYPKFHSSFVLAPEYAAWKKHSAPFERLEGFDITLGANFEAASYAAERVPTGHVTPGFLDMMGVHPQLGRTFRAEEDQPGRNRVAVLSDAFWRSYFHADSKILGQSVMINGSPCTIVGVLPAGFLYPGGADTGVWLPDALNPDGTVPSRRMGLLSVIGRLKPGISLDTARAALEVVARQMDRQYPTPWSAYHAAASVRVVPLQKQLAGGSSTALYILMGAVFFILLIACANVANLFLARGLSREREIAVRAALGASRLQIVRLLMMEGLLLGIFGGALGLAAAFAAKPALSFLMSGVLPTASIDWRVFGFTLACSVAAVFLFCLAPALTASKAQLNQSLKEKRRTVQQALAVVQLALSLVLLIGAGLLLRSFIAVLSVRSGFDPHNVVLADVSLTPPETYTPPRQIEYFDRLLKAVKRLPGIDSAGLSSSTPLVPFNEIGSGLHAEGEPESDATVVFTSASAGYFTALRISLLAGRNFNESDGPSSPRVVILNQTLARLLFKNRDPIGGRIRIDKGWTTVVGVVADIKHRSLDGKIWPEVFRSYTQSPTYWMGLVARASSNPAALIPEIRRVASSIDRSQPLFDLELLEQRVSDSLSQRRERAFLLGAFALVALAIAIVGIYGVISYTVARRTREIGVRMALGATQNKVLGMVIAEGLRIAFTGVALGLAGALVLTRVLSSFLYGVAASDRLTFLGAAALLAAASLVAAFFPAARAARVDPMAALRDE